MNGNLNLHGSKGIIMDQLLSIPQFAQLLNVTVSCIRRWASEHRISVVKVGRLTRIPKTELDRIVAEGTRPARHEDKWKR
jgi:excisionase family DNA binding protein